MFKQESDSEKREKGRQSELGTESTRQQSNCRFASAATLLLFVRLSVGTRQSSFPPLRPLPLFYAAAAAHVALAPPPLLLSRDLHVQKEEEEKKNRLSAPSLRSSDFHKYYF